MRASMIAFGLLLAGALGTLPAIGGEPANLSSDPTAGSSKNVQPNQKEAGESVREKPRSNPGAATGDKPDKPTPTPRDGYNERPN